MIIDIIIGTILGAGIGVILKRFIKFNKLGAFLTASAVWLVLFLFLTFVQFVEETPVLLVSAIAISLYSCIYNNELTNKYKKDSNQNRFKCTFCNKEIKDFNSAVICKDCKHIYHKKCLPELKYCPECGSKLFVNLEKVCNNF